MTNPFDIQSAALARRDRYLQDAETWRMLKPARQERARRLRRALSLSIGWLVPNRSRAQDRYANPVAVAE